jgi:hypothetical protein
MGHGITVRMKEVMSSRTCCVVPVWPRCDFSVTDLPHPLRSVRNVSRVRNFEYSPLVKRVDLDAF